MGTEDKQVIYVFKNKHPFNYKYLKEIAFWIDTFLFPLIAANC